MGCVVKTDDRDDDDRDTDDWSAWGTQLVRPTRVVPLVRDVLRDVERMLKRKLTEAEIADAFVALQEPDPEPARRVGPRRL